jgi:hypothetical protein
LHSFFKGQMEGIVGDRNGRQTIQQFQRHDLFAVIFSEAAVLKELLKYPGIALLLTRP